jgi:hypothetical protein
MMQQRLETLTESIQALEVEASRLRREFARRTLAVVVIVAALVGLSVWLTSYQIAQANAIEENNQRLCPVLAVFADTAAPPKTPREARIAEQAQVLMREFHCAGI